MNITFQNHPAQARHPITLDPLVDDQGEPVPMFPAERSIYMDGVMIGYCSTTPNQPVSLTCHLPIEQVAVIESAVTEAFGPPKSVNQPPLMPTNPLGESDDE